MCFSSDRIQSEFRERVKSDISPSRKSCGPSLVELACIGVLVSRPGRLAIGDGPDGGLLHPAMCPRPMQCIAVCRWVGWRQLVAARWRHLLRNSPTEPHNQSQTVGQDTDQLTLDRWLAFHSIPSAVRKKLSTSSPATKLYQHKGWPSECATNAE